MPVCLVAADRDEIVSDMPPTGPNWYEDGTREGFMKDKDQAGSGKVGEAMGRDATQTKHDVTRGRKGQDLGQDMKDTVKQGTGREAIPPKSVPNPKK